MKTLIHENHPIADLFPIMPPSEMQELVEDIKAHGLLSPITLYEDKILDGRHRYEACQIAEVDPVFTEYTGDDPIDLAISANLHRRQLTTSQRSAVASELASYKHRKGGENSTLLKKVPKTRANDGEKRGVNSPRPVEPPPQMSQKAAAKALNVSPASVKVASKVAAASPALLKDVKDGKITLNAAVKQIEKAKEQKPIPDGKRDETKFLIPTRLLPAFERKAEVQEQLSAISKLRGTLRKAEKESDPLYREVNFSCLIAALDTAYGQFKRAMPHAVCPACNGIDRPGCQQCKGRGYISEHLWETTVLSEIKEMRKTQAAKLESK